MKLPEYKGKEMFRKHGLETPAGVVVKNASELPEVIGKSVVKAQVLSGDRAKHGGISVVENRDAAAAAVFKIVGSKIRNETVAEILVESAVNFEKEYYVSFSFDGATRSPVLSLNAKGGSGIDDASVTPIDLAWGFHPFMAREAIIAAGFPSEDIAGVAKAVMQFWEVFTKEYCTLAEINPLFKTKEGKFVAGDAKVILDDEKHNPHERRYIEMDGDIAILASGGGASMLNIDALLRGGGKPANYTEYSGNPKADAVKELTIRVLSDNGQARRGLAGAWVVGAAANFTDIKETLSGLLDGLRAISPKPDYPIVIRRDGPNRVAAFEMLREAGEKEGFDFRLYDSSMPMVETAKIMADAARQYKEQRKN